jgi:GAF domain-containing protein
MSENQKKVRAERAVITRVLSSTRVEAGLTGTMQQILGEVMSIYGATRVLSASQEMNSYRVFLAEVSRGAGGEILRWREALPETEKAYMFESRADAIYATRNGEGFRTVLLDRDGVRMRDGGSEFLEGLAGFEKFDRVLSVSLLFGTEWAGRVFLFNPAVMGDPEEEMRFLQEVAQQVGPAIYNVYLMRRLRERAGALERARFAR